MEPSTTKQRFCEHCESKGMRHMSDCKRFDYIKEGSAPTSRGNAVDLSGFVTKDEFVTLIANTEAKIDQLLNLIKTTPPPAIQVTMRTPAPQSQPDMLNTPVSVMHDDGTTPKNNEVTLSPEQQRIFEKYFDPEDGFRSYLVMDDKVAHIIDVPQKFSNASPAHWMHYKRDIRQLVLPQGDIAGGLEAHCKKVSANLHYQRNVMTK